MANIDNFEPITTLKMDVIDVKLIKDLSKHWMVEIRTESDIILIDLYSKKHPPPCFPLSLRHNDNSLQ